ncbi:MAG: cell division protein ZapB [Candidatus Binatia bacterium]
MAIDDLEQLEASINQLLSKHEGVRQEKASVEKRLSQKESEAHQLQGQIRQYERERSEIRDKLKKIMGYFDQLGLP